MKLYNTFPKDIDYKTIEMVEGNTVQSRFFIRDFLAGIRALFGLEVIEYTELLQKSREISKQRMIKQAEDLGADAIINVRYMTSEIASQVSEVMIYGTAVKLK